MGWDATIWSDEQLEREIRRHPEDKSLWNELFIRLQPGLFLRARRTSGSDAEAKDLVQEILMIVWEKHSDLDRIRESLYAYINGIAKNVFSQWKREQRKEKRMVVYPADEEENGLPLEIPSPEPDQADQLAHEEAVSMAFGKIKAFFKAKPKHWKVIRLSKIEKLDHSKVAVRLGIKSAGASRKRLHEAVTALTRLCSKHSIKPEELHEAIMRYYDEMLEEG